MAKHAYFFGAGAAEGNMKMKDILGVKIPRVVLPVAAGRNLAVLLEAAVRSTILKLRGIDAMQEFIDRQMRAMDAPSDDNTP